MRSFKLAAAVAAAVGSLALSGAAASAAGRHAGQGGRRSGGCRVTLNVAPRLITAGESALAFGHMSCRTPNEEDGQTVTLYESSASSPGFSVAGTTTTDAHGFYQLSTGALTVNSIFYVTAGRAQSGQRVVKVAAQVTLSGPPEGVVPTNLRTGRHNRVTFIGTVSPADAGALVVLQRQNAVKGNEWHRIDLGVVGKEGSFSITHTFVVPGPANIRVMVHSGRRNIASPSNILSYEISQAQNPSLTIESSANPISYGQSTTISGAVAGAPEHGGPAAGAHGPSTAPTPRWAKSRPTPPATTRSRRRRRSPTPTIRCRARANARRCCTRASNTCSPPGSPPRRFSPASR